MKALAQGGVFQFEGFRLDRQSRVLFRRDEAGAFVPMAVGSRALDVLDVLLDRAGNLVSRDEFMAAVWPATAVEDTNLSMQIAALRRVLDEGRAEGSCIQTIPGRGYRFAAPVTRVAAEARADSALPTGGEPSLPDKPSLAVMPFQNMSGDPEQEYFADGVVEEIITALSRITWLFVIARNSSFTYKGQTVDVKRVGRELGVRYVLEGAVRKASGRVRISAQLIDATTGAHLWADRFDGLLKDIFDLQDQVAASVAGVIEPTLEAAEIRRLADRPTSDLTALDFYLRALPDLDAFAKNGLLRALRVFAGQPEIALQHFQNYLRLSPRDRMATYLNGIGEAYFFSRRFEEAAANLLASLDLAPTFPVTYRVLASCYAHMGRLDDAGEIVGRLRAVTPAVMEPATRYRNPELRELFLSGLRLAACDAS